MSEIILHGFCANVQQITSKKNGISYDVAEFFIPALSGTVKFFQKAGSVYNQVFEDKAKKLLIEYEIKCTPYLKHDGNLVFNVVSVSKKK